MRADASMVPRRPMVSSRLAAPDEDMQTSRYGEASSPLPMERVQPCAPLGFGNGARLDGRAGGARGQSGGETPRGGCERSGAPAAESLEAGLLAECRPPPRTR